MDENLQAWLVYGIVALAALLLLRGWLRRRRACESCPIQEISRRGRERSEPSLADSVRTRATGPSSVTDSSKGDEE